MRAVRRVELGEHWELYRGAADALRLDLRAWISQVLERSAARPTDRLEVGVSGLTGDAVDRIQRVDGVAVESVVERALDQYLELPPQPAPPPGPRRSWRRHYYTFEPPDWNYFLHLARLVGAPDVRTWIRQSLDEEVLALNLGAKLEVSIARKATSLRDRAHLEQVSRAEVVRRALEAYFAGWVPDRKSGDGSTSSPRKVRS